MSESTAEIIRRKQKELLFPNVGTYYEEALPLESGRGMFVKDVEGREYLDFFAGILTVSVGHCHPAVTEAAIAQQRKLVHVSTLYPTVPQLQLAEKLVQLKPMKEQAKEYFEIAVPIARNAGGLFIADEVQTAWGRTGGKWWGVEQYGVEPDILTSAKGMANGQPIGLTMAKAAVADKGTFANISTFGASPISMAAA